MHATQPLCIMAERCPPSSHDAASMQPGDQLTKVLNTIITNVPDWLERLKELPKEIEKNQAKFEAKDNRQVERTRTTLEVPPKQQERLAGSGSHKSITLSAQRRHTTRVTATHYYDKYSMDFFKELVTFVSKVIHQTKNAKLKKRMKRAAKEIGDKDDEKTGNTLRSLEIKLNTVAEKSEKAGYDVLRGIYEKPIAEVIVKLKEVLNYAKTELPGLCPERVEKQPSP